MILTTAAHDDDRSERLQECGMAKPRDPGSIDHRVYEGSSALVWLGGLVAIVMIAATVT